MCSYHTRKTSGTVEYRTGSNQGAPSDGSQPKPSGRNASGTGGTLRQILLEDCQGDIHNLHQLLEVGSLKKCLHRLLGNPLIRLLLLIEGAAIQAVSFCLNLS